METQPYYAKGINSGPALSGEEGFDEARSEGIAAALDVRCAGVFCLGKKYVARRKIKRFQQEPPGMPAGKASDDMSFMLLSSPFKMAPQGKARASVRNP